MAFVQIESAAFLVGEECLDAETLTVRETGILGRVHVADKEDGIFAVLAPPAERKDGTVLLSGETTVGRFGAFSEQSVLGHVLKVKGFALPVKRGVAGRTADITPTEFLKGRKKVHTVKLAVAQKNDLCLWGNQCRNFLNEFDVSLLGQMSLLAPDHSPGDGQRPLFVDQANHESHAPATDRAPVHCQHEGQMGQAGKK